MPPEFYLSFFQMSFCSPTINPLIGTRYKNCGLIYLVDYSGNSILLVQLDHSTPYIRFLSSWWFLQQWLRSKLPQINFFLLTVFGGNILACDVYSSMAMDWHAQAGKWLSTIFLLNWGLIWVSPCSLEACSRILGFLLLTVFSYFSLNLGEGESEENDDRDCFILRKLF